MISDAVTCGTQPAYNSFRRATACQPSNVETTRTLEKSIAVADPGQAPPRYLKPIPNAALTLVATAFGPHIAATDTQTRYVATAARVQRAQ